MDDFNKKSGRSSIGGPSSLVLDIGEEKLFDDYVKTMNHKVVCHVVHCRSYIMTPPSKKQPSKACAERTLSIMIKSKKSLVAPQQQAILLIGEQNPPSRPLPALTRMSRKIHNPSEM